MSDATKTAHGGNADSDGVEELSKLLEEIAAHLDSSGYAHGRWIAHARAARQAASTLSRLRGERDLYTSLKNIALKLRDAADERLQSSEAARLKAEDLNRKLAVSIGAMWDEYMKDECCDYVVINSLIERAHEDARSLLAPLKDRPGT